MVAFSVSVVAVPFNIDGERPNTAHIFSLSLLLISTIWLSSAVLSNSSNFIPAFKGYESDELQPKDPLSAEVLNYANNGKTMPWVFMGYPSGWGENVVGADIQKYLDGSMSWEDLVKNAQKTWAEERE